MRPLMVLLPALALSLSSLIALPAGQAAPPQTLLVVNDLPGIQDVVAGATSDLRVEFDTRTFKAPKPTNAHVTVDPADSGLVFDPDPSGDVTFDGAEVGYEYLAQQSYTATAGLHHITITVTSDNYPTATVKLLVWGEGGPALPSGGSLAGRRLAGTYDTDTGDEEKEPKRHFEVLDFLDAHWVWAADRIIEIHYETKPIRRTPAVCSAAIAGCERYTYSPSTHQFQIGADRGLLEPGLSSYDNLGYDQRFAYPKPGSHLSFSGAQGFDGGSEPKNYSLKLMTNGRYHREVGFVDAGPSSPPFKENGKYVIGKHGNLTLVPNKVGAKQPKQVLSSIGVFLDAHGKPAAAKRGVLFLGIRFLPTNKK